MTDTQSTRSKIAIVMAVAILFIAVLIVRNGDGTNAGRQGGVEAPSIETRDPVAAFEEALFSGKPIYVLFHSKTCAPCAEIEATAHEVLPDYSADVTFVDVITDDPRARPLLSRFRFQYIPTSFFLAADGSEVDSHTGVLDADELRRRLDELVVDTENHLEANPPLYAGHVGGDDGSTGTRD